jgi:hypothetical protein
MSSTNISERFARIQSDVDKIGGFLATLNIAVWDAFLGYQESICTAGHLMEIGVYKGKSAAILAHHQRAGEQLWLVDSSHFIDEARANIGHLSPHEIRYLKQKSVDLHRNTELSSLCRSYRWIHIDGEHTGQALATDLALAHTLLADDGVICIDDFFNPAYPQVAAATFSFLHSHPFDLTLFACGHNKGYLARPTYARHFSLMIRSSLAAELRQRGFSEFTLFKTSSADDYNCWGICQRFGDRDYYGLDANPDEFH